MSAIRVLLPRLEDGADVEVEVLLPARWVICSCCRGDGKSSAYLGAITSDQWHHEWSDDEQADYLAGAYDRPCDDCAGLGRVLERDPEVELSALQAEAVAFLDQRDREDAEDRATRRMESGDWS